MEQLQAMSQGEHLEMLLLLSWCQMEGLVVLLDIIQHVVMVTLLPVFTLLAQVRHFKPGKGSH